ncbi:hypothetical protein EZS27_010154, partial [termite gut metagenome]
MDLKSMIDKLSRDEREELLRLLQLETNVPKFV